MNEQQQITNFFTKILVQNSTARPYYGFSSVIIYHSMLKQTLRLQLNHNSHRIQRGLNPQPIDREANALPSELL